MKVSDQLQILSQIINFTIFIYFAVILIRTNPLDVISIKNTNYPANAYYDDTGDEILVSVPSYVISPNRDGGPSPIAIISIELTTTRGDIKVGKD